MIAIDSNILVYAHRQDLPQYPSARKRVEALAEGHALWGVPVFCLAEFFRVVTHPRIFENPHSSLEARRAIEHLTASPSLRVLFPGSRFTPLFLEAIEESGATGNLAFDAQVVALCREAGVRSFLTEDRDFARFRGFPTERLSASPRGA